MARRAMERNDFVAKKKQTSADETEQQAEIVNDETNNEKQSTEQSTSETYSESLPNNFEAELTAEKDKYLRLAAEYDNYRKRSQKEREALYTDVKAETVTKLLPVYDNLKRALEQQTEDQAFYRGVEMTMTQLLDILSKLGVKPIEAIGHNFDPSMHNAVMHIEDEDVGENTVVEEFQTGFLLGDKVIRFSMVKVAN